MSFYLEIHRESLENEQGNEIEWHGGTITRLLSVAPFIASKRRRLNSAVTRSLCLSAALTESVKTAGITSVHRRNKTKRNELKKKRERERERGRGEEKREKGEKWGKNVKPERE